MRLFVLLLTVPLLAQDAFTGAPVEREILTGQAHTYRYAVQAGVFITLTAAQLDGDVVILMTGPDGYKYSERNLLSRKGAEQATWISPATGDCLIEIRNKTQFRARYRLEASTRTPTTADRRRHEGFMAAVEAKAAFDLRTREGFTEAEKKYERAAAEWRAAGDPEMEASTINMAGVSYFFLGQPAKAVAFFEEAAALARGRPEALSTLCSALNNIGPVRENMGDLPRARKALEEAVPLFVQLGDPSGEAQARANLGNNYRRAGLFAEAKAHLARAAALQKTTKNRQLELQALINLGLAHRESRDYEAALRQFSECLRMSREAGSLANEFGSLANLGSTYVDLGETGQAAQFFVLAEAVARKLDQPTLLATALSGLAAVKLRAREYAAARTYLEETAALSRKYRNDANLANALNGLCSSYMDAVDAERAKPYAAEAMEVNGRVSPVDGYSRAVVCAARIARSERRTAEARKLLEDGLAKAGTHPARVNYLDALAELEEGEGKLLASLGYTEEAAAMAEMVRSQIPSPALRATAAAAGVGRARRQVGLLMKAGYGERAYVAAERARARSLTEMIADAGRFQRAALSAEQATQEEKLVTAIAGVQRQLFREGLPPARQAALRRELAAAEIELEAFQAQFARVSGARANLERLVLDGSTALVEYSLGEKESYAWVVTAAGVKSFVLAGGGAIEERVTALRELLGKPVNALTAGRSLGAIDAEAGRVYGMVMGPLATALTGKTRLVIVPDGRLHYLPFEVLPGVLDKYRISYAPSASVLAALRKRGAERVAPERTLLAVADPVLTGAAAEERGFAFTQLPNARAEATALRGLFGGARLLVGAEAGEGAVKGENLGAYRYLHFATHGYFDEAVPGRSGLVLGQGREEDGFLQAREILGLTLQADVVTLSACQSGLGKLLAGEGVVGLSRAFLYAGAQSLVVSLWNVNDAATAELMKVFYRGLKAGLGRDEALRRAKVSLAKGGNRAWRHPYYWAPFVFVGDGA